MSAKVVMQRIEALARISDEPGCLTRTFGSPGMKRANAMVASWMCTAGMEVRTDAVGNLIGHYPGQTARCKILMLGSHLDTVRNAGKFDGPLGVLLAIACVEELHRRKTRLPFAVEMIAFADEEGLRFQTAYLGSRALAGTLSKAELSRCDSGGISMREAILNFGGDPARLKTAGLKPRNVIGYLEAHIEQGPVLEQKNLGVGLVIAIAGQSRVEITFTGQAGHAGTTPMELRHDALCAASEFILGVESTARKKKGLVATVGQIDASPNASNVIPGEVRMTIDARHQNDFIRRAATRAFQKFARQIAARRNVRLKWRSVMETPATACSRRMSESLRLAIRKHVSVVLPLASGAGHDAAVLSQIVPVAMLFIRCKKGISHHPDESATERDVRMALKVMNEFLQILARRHE